MLAWLALALSAVLVLGAFIARPAPVLGVDGKPLQNSVGGRGIEACEQLEDRVWSCRHYDDSLSGTVPYRVSVDFMGCWTATRTHERGAPPSPQKLEGCLTLIDYF